MMLTSGGQCKVKRVKKGRAKTTKKRKTGPMSGFFYCKPIAQRRGHEGDSDM